MAALAGYAVESHAAQMNLEAPTAASPIPARIDKWGTVVGTDLIRAPWQGRGVPDIGCRFVQHGDGTVGIYDRNNRLVYSVPSAEVANNSFGSTQAFVRKTPSWAIVLGIIGLLFFLLGLLFFLRKENVPYTAATITVTSVVTVAEDRVWVHELEGMARSMAVGPLPSDEVARLLRSHEGWRRSRTRSKRSW